MKNLVKVLVLASVILMLAVSASGCVTTTPTPTPTAEPTGTQDTPQTPAAATTAPKATTTPKATTSKSIPEQIESYFTGQGYSIYESFTYTKVNTKGYSQYDGMLSKDGHYTAVDITVCPTTAAAQYDLKIGVTAAGILGYTGSYTSSTHWTGTRTSSEGDVYTTDMYTTSNNWSVMQTGVVLA